MCMITLKDGLKYRLLGSWGTSRLVNRLLVRGDLVSQESNTGQQKGIDFGVSCCLHSAYKQFAEPHLPVHCQL